MCFSPLGFICGILGSTWSPPRTEISWVVCRMRSVINVLFPTGVCLWYSWGCAWEHIEDWSLKFRTASITEINVSQLCLSQLKVCGTFWSFLFEEVFENSNLEVRVLRQFCGEDRISMSYDEEVDDVSRIIWAILNRCYSMIKNWWRKNEKEWWMLDVFWRWVLGNWWHEYEKEEEEEEKVKSCWEQNQVGGRVRKYLLSRSFDFLWS